MVWGAGDHAPRAIAAYRITCYKNSSPVGNSITCAHHLSRFIQSSVFLNSAITRLIIKIDVSFLQVAVRRW